MLIQVTLTGSDIGSKVHYVVNKPCLLLFGMIISIMI